MGGGEPGPTAHIETTPSVSQPRPLQRISARLKFLQSLEEWWLESTASPAPYRCTRLNNEAASVVANADGALHESTAPSPPPTDKSTVRLPAFSLATSDGDNAQLAVLNSIVALPDASNPANAMITVVYAV
jgi:hypothetical protein